MAKKIVTSDNVGNSYLKTKFGANPSTKYPSLVHGLNMPPNKIQGGG